MMLNSSLGRFVMGLARRSGLPVPRDFPQAHRRLAPELIGHAGDLLDGVGRRNEAGGADSHRPYFLFMNFMDVHSPYVPLAGSPRRFWTDPLPARQESVPEAGWRALHARDASPPDRRPERQRELDVVTRRLIDLYDAREGGGIPAETETGRGECQGEACQLAVSPPNDPTPASSSFEGAGNVNEEPKAAKKHAKKHKKKNAKKRHSKKHSKKRAAKRNRGGAK